MLELLLLIIGCYAAAAMVVHLCFRMGGSRERPARHYVFIAGQRQKNMEWYMRSLFSFSRWMGKEVRLTVVDRGLDEEDRAVVERWQGAGRPVRIHQGELEMPPSENKDGKRCQHEGVDEAAHVMWTLRTKGIVSDSEQAVLIDLQNPADLSKMPF